MSYVTQILLIPASAEWSGLIHAHVDRHLPVFDSENDPGFFVGWYLCVKKRLQCAVRRSTADAFWLQLNAAAHQRN